MMSEKVATIIKFLDEKYPDAHCELNYSNVFELLVAVCLSAQTTDNAVNKTTVNLFKRYKSIADYANADINELEGYLKTIGLYRNKARNLKQMANELIENFNCVVPNSLKQLTTLSGVGRKTANVVLAEYFKIPALAVDTHVYRVSKRLGLIKEKDDVVECETKLKRKFPKSKWIKLHHQLIFFGRYFCKAKNPNCRFCGLKEICKEIHKNI